MPFALARGSPILHSLPRMQPALNSRISPRFLWVSFSFVVSVSFAHRHGLCFASFYNGPSHLRHIRLVCGTTIDKHSPFLCIPNGMASYLFTSSFIIHLRDSQTSTRRQSYKISARSGLAWLTPSPRPTSISQPLPPSLEILAVYKFLSSIV
jgi:hypothetical protein